MVKVTAQRQLCAVRGLLGEKINKRVKFLSLKSKTRKQQKAVAANKNITIKKKLPNSSPTMEEGTHYSNQMSNGWALSKGVLRIDK